MTIHPPPVRWGTNPPGGIGRDYGGRVHIVLSPTRHAGLCGLPVRAVTMARPPAHGRRLCPECCLLAVATLYPEVRVPQRKEVL